MYRYCPARNFFLRPWVSYSHVNKFYRRVRDVTEYWNWHKSRILLLTFLSIHQFAIYIILSLNYKKEIKSLPIFQLYTLIDIRWNDIYWCVYKQYSKKISHLLHHTHTHIKIINHISIKPYSIKYQENVIYCMWFSAKIFVMSCSNLFVTQICWK